MQGLFACALLSFVALGLLGARAWITRSDTFGFLAWNLVLAWVPFALSAVVLLAARGRTSWRTLLALGVPWLLFFPNAPYVLTDLVHLGGRGYPVWWLDVAVVASFALAALFLGLFSLTHVEETLRTRGLRRLAPVAAVGACVLSGLGLYVGRFLRWNSWDAVSQPHVIAADLLPMFVEPRAHGRAWGVTVVFGAIVAASYLALRAGRADDSDEPPARVPPAGPRG